MALLPYNYYINGIMVSLHPTDGLITMVNCIQKVHHYLALSIPSYVCSWRMNASFGLITGLLSLTKSIVWSKLHPYSFIANAMTCIVKKHYQNPLCFLRELSFVPLQYLILKTWTAIIKYLFRCNCWMISLPMMQICLHPSCSAPVFWSYHLWPYI